MKKKNLLSGLALLVITSLSASAQSYVPTNMDFETGTTANWNYFHGTVLSGHLYSISPTSATPGHHTLMSGTGTDTYGGFPVVGTGSYSLRLNDAVTGYQADAASYNIAVPGTGTYGLIYQYAAVLEDPGHPPADQPVFEVQAIDSATGTVFFDSVIVDPTPGFTVSTVNPFPFYKAWTNVSVDLSAYAGKTVTVKFIAAGCADGGHFGYAYIDVAGMFETSSMLALHAPSVTLKAPAGYSAYKWTDAATFAASYGTTATVTIAAPAAKTKYALILTPYTGHGTVDTVYTTVTPAPTLGSGTMTVNEGFGIYPNPSSGITNIQWNDQQTGTATLEVTDVTGRVVSNAVLDMTTASGRQQIDLSREASGIYFVTVRSGSVNYTGRVNVQR